MARKYTTVEVTPLCGVYDENPVSYLLSIDGYKLLLDCGWNDAFDPSLIEPLSRVAARVDAVLLSHPDTLHIGALPYAMKQLGLSPPVFATEPVRQLGELTMIDQFYSRRKKLPGFDDLFTLVDIQFAFGSVVELAYSQEFHLSGKGKGIVIAPHAAGHMLGGSIWKITKNGEEVIYAVDYNHQKERHLNATVLESFVRPAVLITDAYNARYTNKLTRQQIDKEFLDTITKHLEAKGKALLPVDTAGRVLELLLILEQHWSQKAFSYPIYFLTYVSSDTIHSVKSVLEWMSDSVSKSFPNNAFLLSHVTLLKNKTDLHNAPTGPKVVLASMASLEAGFARDIFLEWADDPSNLVLFTETSQPGTLARELQSSPPPKSVEVTISERVFLLGEELIEEEQNRLQRQDPHGPEDNHDAVVPCHGPAYKDILIDGFVSQSTSVAPMFPFFDNTSEWDDYGKVTNPDDYVIKDQDMDPGAMRIRGNTVDRRLDTRPSKLISNDHTVTVSCSLVKMDYEGRSDAPSIKSTIARVSPLKLVLVHAMPQATKDLMEYCLDSICPHVHAPKREQTVDVTPQLSSSMIQLFEQLESNVKPEQVMNPRDRISALPDELRCLILSFLSTRNAAKTSLLSKNWLRLYLSTSRMRFFYQEDTNEREFMNFVDKTIKLRGKLPLNDLSLSFTEGVDGRRVHGWVAYALDRGVSNLEILGYGMRLDYWLGPPHFVFLSSKLVKLSIGCDGEKCVLPERYEYNLPVLKKLCLEDVFFQGGGSGFEKLLSGCPVLEELVMRDICQWCQWDSCVVSSQTLKSFSFGWGNDDAGDCKRCPASVSFNTPRLISLQYDDNVSKQYPTMNLGSLIHARICLRMFAGSDSDSDSDEDEYENEHVVENDAAAAAAFFQGISNVRTLFLSLQSLDVLGFFEIPQFNNVRDLQFKRDEDTNGETIDQLVEMCPNVVNIN